jgi:16S rRNA U516 pseudouridylate synthase RsuA-like enzyme
MTYSTVKKNVMRNLVQQYYVIMEEKVSTTTFTKLWMALKHNLGASYLDVQLERLCKNKRKQLLSLIPHHNAKGKPSILSIQLTNAKIGELRDVLTKSGLKLLKLVRIPINMKEQELVIPPNIMRDLF